MARGFHKRHACLQQKTKKIMMETGCLLTTVLLLENRIISISTLWDIAPIQPASKRASMAY